MELCSPKATETTSSLSNRNSLEDDDVKHIYAPVLSSSMKMHLSCGRRKAKWVTVLYQALLKELMRFQTTETKLSSTLVRDLAVRIVHQALEHSYHSTVLSAGCVEILQIVKFKLSGSVSLRGCLKLILFK